MNGLVVELAGPAGAGKTTLARELLSSGTPVVGAAPPRNPARAMAAAVPTLALARLSRPGRWWTQDELRALAYLSAWRGEVSGRRDTTDLLFDHGPAFRLARLATDGPPMAGSRAFERLWLRLARDWARLLGVVVWLDAPDSVLLARITARPGSHRVTGLDAAEANAFLGGYREAYARTLDVLEREGVRLVRFDTSTRTKEQLAHEVLGALDQRCRQ